MPITLHIGKDSATLDHYELDGWEEAADGIKDYENKPRLAHEGREVLVTTSIKKIQKAMLSGKWKRELFIYEFPTIDQAKALKREILE